jgi:hypothetical protein
VELKINQKSNNKSRIRIKSCKSKDELRAVLLEEKVWRVTFKEQLSEDKIPGQGWCGYLAVNQVRRNAEAVQVFDQAGVRHLSET